MDLARCDSVWSNTGMTDKKLIFPSQRLFRDPVHGQIEFDRDSPYDRFLLELIDTPEFQRLRRVRQLGLASMAYPGAEHTRFSHSLGVCQVMRRALAHLQRGYDIGEDQVFVARCAALLHDAGHGPFSHVLESLFGGSHEEWSARVALDPDSRVSQLMTEFDLLLPTLVVDLMQHHYQPRFLSHLISSQLDADRFDYLLRDSHMTGVTYGVFDLDRLIAMLDIDKSRDQLVVSRRGVTPVEQYLLSRHQMFRQVYQHKTALASEAMLRGLLGRAREMALHEGGCEGVEPESAFGRSLAVESMDQLDLPDYLDLDDFTIWHYIKRWSRADDPILADLSRRLLARDLFKTLSLPEFDRARFNEAAAYLKSKGVDPKRYLIKLESRDMPYKPYDPKSRKPTTSIFLQDSAAPRGYVDIAERSGIVRALMDESHPQTHIIFPASHNGARLRETITQIFGARQ